MDKTAQEHVEYIKHNMHGVPLRGMIADLHDCSFVKWEKQDWCLYQLLYLPCNLWMYWLALACIMLHWNA